MINIAQITFDCKTIADALNENEYRILCTRLFRGGVGVHCSGDIVLTWL